MALRERLAAGAALIWGLGCGPAPTTGSPAASASSAPVAVPARSADLSFALASLAEAAPVAGPAPAWGDPVPVDAQGDGQEVHVTLPAGRAALRLSPAPLLDDDTRCYRLDGVKLGALDWLPSGPDCLGCGLPLSSRPTEGFWVLPGADTAQTATLRFSLLDCLTGDGRSAAQLAQQGNPLRWQVLGPSPLAAEATLEARIGLAQGVTVLGGADGGRAFWSEILAGVRGYFADAGVRVVVSRLAELPAPDRDPVTSQAGDEQELARWASTAAAALGPGAGQVYLPVVVVPCLERDDLISGHDLPVAGFTPRIPGGARAEGRAEAIFLAGTCTPDDEPPVAARIARVMAHEVGHYLGLYHSNSPAGQPLSEPGKVDLMDPDIVYLEEPLTWSPRQREALRLHPLLR